MSKFGISVKSASKRAINERVKGFLHKPLSALLCISFLITLNLFLLLPFVIYQGNIDEFPVPFTSILSFFLTPAAGLSLVLMAIGLLLPKALQRRYISVLFIVGVLILVQGNLLVWKYGLLDGQGIDWAKSPWRGYVDGLLWGLLLVLAYFFYRQIYRIVAPATIVLVFLQLFFIGFSIAQKSDTWKEKKEISCPLLPPEELFQFSSRQNVIHILMDGFQSDIFQEIIEQDPDFYDNALQGFTFFREATGSFPTTKMSLPAIFSGKIYLNDVPMPRFLNTVLKGKTIPNVLYDNGYDIDLALDLSGIGGQGKHSTRYIIPVPYGVTERDYEQASSALMLDLVLFRCLPHFIKKYVYNNQAWLIQRLLFTQLGFLDHKDRWGVSTFRYFSHKAFMVDMIDNMSTNRNKPVYKFIHLCTTHPPIVVNRHCEFAGHALPKTRANKKTQCKCSLDHVIEFLNKLKLMGIYDSSLLILSADTGDGIKVNLKNRGYQIDGDEINSIKGFANIVGSALPLMAIKPPNGKGPLKISRAQTMLSHIPATVSSILHLNAGFPGQPAFEVSPDQLQERRFYYYKWRHKNWQDDYFDRMDEFIIRGSVFDTTSWQKGLTFYPPKKAKKDNKLRREGFRNSMKVSKDYRDIIVVKKREIFRIPVLLKNTSPQKWIARGKNNINLAYHWRKNTGKVVVRDGIRSPIPHNLNPGEKVEIMAKVVAPNAIGEYILEFDMVQEQVAWFGWMGAETLRLAVVVK